MKIKNCKVSDSIRVSMAVLLLVFLSGCGGGGGEEGSPVINLSRPPGAVAIVSGNGQVTVSWNNNGATSYNIYMATKSGVKKTNTGLAGWVAFPNVTSPYTITPLTNNTPYYFVVTSVNSLGESAESSEVSATPSASVSLTVIGTVKYEDKKYGISGFTGNTSYQAVRFAEVEAVDVLTNAVVATATTGANGSYNLPLLSTAQDKTIYIRIISAASSPVSSATPLVNVKSTSGVFYAVAGANFAATGAAMTQISIPVSNPAAGAFNILDVFTSGAEFVQSLSRGAYPTVATAFWQTGNSLGTYYCSGGANSTCPRGAGIYVLSYGGDTDEYDDDVLWHEYGHFIADKYSKDDSPGGKHRLTSNDLDLRLTWSEGWGDFFPTAVKIWLGSTLRSSTAVPSMYVDTSGTSGGYFDFGIPYPDDTNRNYFYSSNEAAVAKVLIESSAAHTMQNVWDTFASIQTATSPVNLEVFWDAWNFANKPDIAAILAERQIKYSADSYEGDNSPNSSRKATAGVGENHTLYGSTDIDYIAFDANANQQYTIKTTALKGGADTFISIIKPDLTVATTNDNANNVSYTNSVPCPLYSNDECHENGYDILGSTKIFTPIATGTYYVEVKSSLNRPLSAGKYGEYSLTITSP